MSSQSSKSKKGFSKINPLEFLRDSISTTAQTIGNELVKPMGMDIQNQLFGVQNQPRNYSGELSRGETLHMPGVLSGEQAERQKLQKQIQLERRLRAEESQFVQRRTQELQLQFQSIQQEVTAIAQATPKLTQELSMAVMRPPVDVNTFEIFFIQHIFKVIRDFRMNIENASVWLASVNKRNGKRNVWGQNYKKYGAKYLLSSEHYSQRSAG